MLKSTVALVCALFTVILCNAQKTDSTPSMEVVKPVEEKVYETFDITKFPEYPGGLDSMQNYLSQQLKYPEEARKNAKSGTAVVNFIVEADGSISTVNVLKDPGMGMGEEAKRVISVMPKWSPGELQGKPVRVKFMLPVRFKLE